VEAGQQLGGATTEVFVRLPRRLPRRLPGGARLGNGLIGAGFVLAPQLQPERCAETIGTVDQLFLGVASGSVVVTTDPSFRLRRAVPVWHQLRLRWYV
jgi:hypothetical protein